MFLARASRCLNLKKENSLLHSFSNTTNASTFALTLAFHSNPYAISW